MLSAAHQVLSRLEKQGSPDKWLAHARGELDLASGRTEQGIRELQNAVKLYQVEHDAHRYMAAIALAQALDRQGKTSGAIEILQPMVEPRSGDRDDLELDSQLAGLYRKVGREEEAERLEARVQNQLAYADADDVLLDEAALSSQRAIARNNPSAGLRKRVLSPQKTNFSANCRLRGFAVPPACPKAGSLIVLFPI